MKEVKQGPPPEIKRINDTTWELPTSYKKGMKVPARIIANEELMGAMDAGVFNQITNVATLPGIQRYAFCMPDGHWGFWISLFFSSPGWFPNRRSGSI